MGIQEAPNGSNGNDKPASILHHSDCFDMYVNPGDRAIWDDHATAVHGLKATDECIKNADDIRVVYGTSFVCGSMSLLLMCLP